MSELAEVGARASVPEARTRSFSGFFFMIIGLGFVDSVLGGVGQGGGSTGGRVAAGPQQGFQLMVVVDPGPTNWVISCSDVVHWWIPVNGNRQQARSQGSASLRDQAQEDVCSAHGKKSNEPRYFERFIDLPFAIHVHGRACWRHKGRCVRGCHRSRMCFVEG